jgi:hypothetical protein
MIGADVSLAGPVTLSPDGTTLVFVGRQAEQNDMLFVRRLDQLEATALAGTEGGLGSLPAAPSRESRWLAGFPSMCVSRSSSMAARGLLTTPSFFRRLPMRVLD